MKAHRKKKLITILVVIGLLLSATLMIMYALRQNISLFYTPEQVSLGELPKGAVVRLGGMVVKGSIERSDKSLEVTFDLTDFKKNVSVRYHGVLPTLFREGQGIVARGKLDKNNVFVAEEILAKHDSNYMPPEVKAALAKKDK